MNILLDFGDYDSIVVFISKKFQARDGAVW
jgi:hypothetical protein